MKIGILSIATNIYVNYWKALAQSINDTLETSHTVTLHIFTDQIEDIDEFRKSLTKVKVISHKIEPMGWPDATLKRYEIFSNFASEILEPILVYLDADMLVEQDISHDIFKALSTHKIALVAHPGYWTQGPLRDLLTACSDIRNLVTAVKRFFVSSSRGSWEDNELSTAFVPKRLRKRYVCGGVWMGHRAELLELIEILKETVSMDLANGIVAKWHDESHLNRWAASNKFELLDPSFCYVKEYHYLSNLEAKIVAVTKENRTR